MKWEKLNRWKIWSRENQKWLFGIMALLMVTAILLMVFFVEKEGQMELKEPVYQYFGEKRMEYEAGTKLIAGKFNVIFRDEDVKNDGDESPIYTEEGRALILPNDCYWIDGVSGGEWLVPQFSRLEMDEAGAIWCINPKKEKQKIRLGSGFIGDARGTYLFLEPARLQVNGTETEVNAFSFYSVRPTGIVRIYHYSEEQMICQDDWKDWGQCRAVRGYTIDFTAGIYTAQDGSRRMLTASPRALSDLFEK